MASWPVAFSVLFLTGFPVGMVAWLAITARATASPPVSASRSVPSSLPALLSVVAVMLVGSSLLGYWLQGGGPGLWAFLLGVLAGTATGIGLFTNSLLRASAAVIPPEQRDRWVDEWKAELEKLPSAGGRSRFLVPLLVAVVKLAILLRLPRNSQQAPPPPSSPTYKIVIHASIGQLNVAGDLNVQNINSHIAAIAAQGEVRLAEAFQKVGEAVVGEPSFSDEVRSELLGGLDDLVQAAEIPEEGRKADRITVALATVSAAAAGSSTLEEAWVAWGPTIEERFPTNRGDLVSRSLVERVLAIQEKVLGAEHSGTATSLNNLAALLQDQGELAAARPLYERALAIRERVLGPEHPDTAITLTNLAFLLQAQGELAAARPLLERALAIRERVLGPEHPDTATTLTNLANLLRAQGELDAAQLLYERALRVHGPDHPDTATTLNNLANLLRAQGDPETARRLDERARTISRPHSRTGESSV